jgi:hypothetical protein
MSQSTARLRERFLDGDYPSVLFDDKYRECVCFLCTEDVDNESTSRKTAHGTAFFVKVPVDQDSNKIYLVTARHNVEESRNEGKTLYAKLNIKSGGVEYVPIPEGSWTSHGTTDVALVPFQLEERFRIEFVHFDHFANDSYIRLNGVDVGDDLFLPGLFTPYSQSEQAEPIGRFGRVSLGLRKISVNLNSGSFPTRVDAYLAETQSWSGESGSPVFHCKWPFSNRQRIDLNDPRGPRLLGLLHGHFPIKQKSHKKDDAVDLNSGIAIVIPANPIIELLMRPEFVAEREALKARRILNVNVPTPD